MSHLLSHPAYIEFARLAPWRALWGFVAIVFCLTPLVPWLAAWIRRAWRRVARRSATTFAIVCILSLTVNIALTLHRGLPLPHVHDEFSYLLAADTFAHRRLTNPPHPMSIFFQSMHVLVLPTYQSKYPPGQGLILAFGQVVFARPIVGVWLTTALACVAISWAIRAWLGTAWALLAGAICTIHPQVLEWSQSYWGGSLAMLGGALVLGALGQLLKSHVSRRWLIAALALATGLAILANTRPFEGFVLAAIVSLVLLFNVPRLRAPILPVGLSVASILLLIAAWMAYYNFRVTGSPLRMPYLEHQAQYGAAPLFIFQKPQRTPLYSDPEIEHFYAINQLNAYNRRQTLAGFGDEAKRTLLERWYAPSLGALGDLPNPLWSGIGTMTGWDELERRKRVRVAALQRDKETKGLTPKQTQTLESYADETTWRERTPRSLPISAIMLAAALPIAIWRDRKVRLVAAMLALFAAALLTETFMQPHYAAPAAILVALLVCLLLRRISRWRIGRSRIGPRLAALVVLLAAINSAVWCVGFYNSDQKGFPTARNSIERNFRAQRPGKHLVFVHYSQHKQAQEWVYNRADIDSADIVWARDRGEIENRRLIDYFKDRNVWLLEPDQPNPQPVDYAATRPAVEAH